MQAKPRIHLLVLVALLAALGGGIAAADDSIEVKRPASADTVSTATVASLSAEAGSEEVVPVEEETSELPPVYTLTAEEAIALALANSYGLRIAEKQAESAYFEYVKYTGMAGLSIDLSSSINRAGPLKGISTGSNSPEMTFQKETTSSLGARASYPIAPLGNLGYGKRAAWAGYQAAKAAVDAKRAEVITAAFRAYIACLTAQNAVEVAEEGVALGQEQLRNARLKYEQGMVPRFQVMQAEVEASLAEEALIKARNGKELARSGLYLTLGVVPEDYFQGMEVEVAYAEKLDRAVGILADEVLPRLDPEGLSQTFVEKTPQYHSLDNMISVYDYQMLGYRRAPQFSLTAGYQQQTGSSFQARDSWSFGISGVMNLWDSGKTAGTQKSFAAQADAARVQLAQYRQAFRLSMVDAVSNLEAAVQGHTTAQDTLAAAEEAQRMARLGYNEGVVTNADLVGARAAYLGAKLNEFDKRMAIVARYQDLLAALGIGDADLYLPTTTSDLSAITARIINDEKN